MKRIFEIIFRNFFAKIVCLLLAMGIWLYVGTGQAKIDTFPGRILLDFVNVQSGLVAVSEVENVSIKIVADGTTWQSLGSGSFTATIDLANLNEGTYELPVKVTSQAAVQIVEINPQKVLVRLEKITKKEVPVNLVVEGKPAQGLVVGDWKIKPDRVEVAGASSVIAKIFEATAKLSLNGENSTVQKMVRLVALDANGNEIRNLVFQPFEVEVDVPLVQASSAKTVGIKVVTTGQPAAGFWVSKIESTPAAVAVTASSSLISQISFIETKEIDINGLSADRQYETTLKPTPGVVILDNVNLVKVKISVSLVNSTRQVSTGFNFQNLSSNLKVTSVDPQKVTVVVTGSATDLAKLDAGEVRINLDLGRFVSAGTYSLDITRANIDLPSGIGFSSVVPSALNVRLENR